MRPTAGSVAAAALSVAACFAVPRSLPAPSLPDQRFEYRQEVQTFELTNGARLAVIPEPGANLVELDVRYRTGAVEDPPGKEGLAHLVEHLMFSLRDGPDAPTFGDRLAALALDFNAYTSWDETHYVELAPAGLLPQLLALERTRFATDCAHIDDEILDRERDVVVQEILQRGDTVGRVAAAVFGDDHPYGRPVGGTPESLRAISRDDVCDFLAGGYAPDRAIVVISGAVDAAWVKGLAEQDLGAVPRRIGRPRAPVTPMAARPPVHLALPLDPPTALIAFPAAPAVTEEGARLSVLAELLRQHLATRDEIGRVSVLQVGGDRDPAMVFALVPAKSGAVDTMPDRFFTEVSKLREELDPIELEWAKTRRRVELMTSVEPLPRRASRVADALQYDAGRPPLYHEMGVVKDAKVASITELAATFRRDRARVVLTRREPSGAAVTQLGDLGQGHEHDIAVWHEPVDPAQARAPMRTPHRPTVTHRRELTLDNGLRVILVSGLAESLVNIRLLVPAGYDAAPTEPALPLLAANLLGSPDLRHYRMRDNIAYYDAFARGGVRDVEIDDHWTTFSLRGVSPDVGVLLWQLAVPLTDGVYRDDVLSDLPGWIAAMPGAKPTDAQLRRRLLSGKESASDGLKTSLGRVHVGDLRRFRGQHYRAAGATLIVAGQFDEDQVARDVRRLFGRLPPGNSAPATTTLAAGVSGLPAARDLGLVRPTAVQLHASMSFPLPSKLEPHRAAAYAIAREIIEARAAVLRQGMGVTYGVGVDAEKAGGQRFLTLSAQLAPSAAADALTVLASALRDLRAGREIDADVVRARRRLVAKLLITAVDSGAAADEVQTEVVHQLPADYEQRMVSAVAGVTRDDVARALAEMLAPEHETRLLLGTRSTVEAGFRALGVHTVVWQQ